MATLGAPVTNRFMIGTAELRLGPQSSAAKLTQAHSVGLIDNSSFNVEVNSTDLLGGFPQQIIDTAITSQTGQMTATLREYSRSNLSVLLGQGIATSTTDIVTTLSGPVTGSSGTPDSTITVAAGTGIQAGDLLGIFISGQPESLSLVRVASVATNDITLEADMAVERNYTPATDGTVYVVRYQPLPIGVMTINYFSAMLLQVQRGTAENRPMGVNFWKVAIASGVQYAAGGTEFASTELTLKVLQPAASEYATGKPLEHLAAVIPTNPTAQFFISSDAAV